VGVEVGLARHGHVEGLELAGLFNDPQLARRASG
jgi:hypothetical protein